MRWLRALMPREERFLDLFQQHSKVVLLAAHAMRSVLNARDDLEFEQSCSEVMRLENDADRVTADVLIAIRRSFITPFDRGDIKDLISSMDDTVDEMKKATKMMTLYKFRDFTPDMRNMGDCIVECAALMDQVVPLLGNIGTNAGRINEITGQMVAIEGQADDISDTGLARLYDGAKLKVMRGEVGSGLEFQVGSAIIDRLEKVVDRFDDVANEIHGIVVEHV